MGRDVAPLPAVFLGHGSPLNTLAVNRYTDAWRAFGAGVPRPRAILCISAHWYTDFVGVTAMAEPPTIHDFGGFPPALSEFLYPAPGDPQLAARVAELLAPLAVRLDHGWGLDHGTWSVLAHAFPAADVPVVQLSIDATQPPRYHYDTGRTLAPLRAEGVLVVASGNVVHNLARLDRRPGAPAHSWATRFEQSVRGWLLERDHAALLDYEALGEDAALSVPTAEHFLPLLYLLGLQREDESAAILVDGIERAGLSMLSVAVGLRPEAEAGGSVRGT